MSTMLTALATHRGFVTYRLAPIAGSTKKDKIPFNGETGHNSNAQDQSTWLLPNVAQAFAAEWAPTYKDGTGVGLVVYRGSQLFCIDLDGCIDESGNWSDVARGIVARFPGAVVEVSASGRGLHIFGVYRGVMPPHKTKNSAHHLELYTEGRFIALTGNFAPGHEAGHIGTDCTDALFAFAGEYFPKSGGDYAGEWTEAPAEGWNFITDDDELIQWLASHPNVAQRMGGRAPFDALFNADADVLGKFFSPNTPGQSYDASSADQSLANILAWGTGNNCERTAALMQRSALKRAKWERDDYLNGTVAKACSGAKQWPTLRDVPAGAVVPTGTVAPSPAAASAYVIQSLEDVLQRPDLEWLVEDVLPMQGLASIYGKWGTGKSFLVIDLAGAVSAGKLWFNREVKQAGVLYVVLEGDGGIKQRMQAYLAEHGEKPAHLQFITGDSFNLLTGSPDIARMQAALRAIGWKNGLLIVDTLSAAIPGGNENATEVMTAAIENLKAIQREFGGLVLFVHHTGKDEAKGMRGSSSLPAALDASVEISREDNDPNQRWWATSKVKDGPDDSRVGFKLKVVPVGTDKRGKAITSCVVVPDAVAGADVPVHSFKPVRPPKIGDNERKVLVGLPALLTVQEHTPKEVPPGQPCVDFIVAATALKDSMPGESNRLYSKARSALESLAAKGLVSCAGGYVWMPTPQLVQQSVTATAAIISQ